LARQADGAGGWIGSAISSAFGKTSDPAELRKLVRSQSPSLQPLIGQTMQPADWQRTGSNIPTAAMVEELRSRLSDLEKGERQELDEVARSRATEKQRLLGSIEAAAKDAALMGGISLHPSDARVRLEPGEKLRIECRGFKLKRRTRDGIPYWDVDAEGELVVTNTRVMFLSSAEVDEWPYSRIVNVDVDSVGRDPLLVLWLDRLKKPIGVHPTGSNLSVQLEGRHWRFNVAFEDVLKVVKRELG
jgi:hypothetical protein